MGVPDNRGVGLWKTSCAGHPSCPLRPIDIVSQHQSENYKTRASLAIFNPAVFVRGSAVTAFQQLDESHASLFGCYSRKRNVCRAILEGDIGERFDNYVYLFKAWSDGLSREEARSAEQLVLLKARAPADRACDRVAFLIDLVLQPKVQYFGLCCMDSVASDSVEFLMPDESAFPVRMELASRLGRVSDRFLSLDIQTSDELALSLARTGYEFDLCPLTWELVDGGNLLEFQVTGKGEAWFKPMPKRKQANKKDDASDPFQFLAAHDNGDPLTHGRRNAMNLGETSPSAPPESHDEQCAELDDAIGIDAEDTSLEEQHYTSNLLYDSDTNTKKANNGNQNDIIM